MFYSIGPSIKNARKAQKCFVFAFVVVVTNFDWSTEARKMWKRLQRNKNVLFSKLKSKVKIGREQEKNGKDHPLPKNQFAESILPNIVTAPELIRRTCQG